MKKPRDTSLPERQSSNRRQCDERVELLEVIKEMVEAEVDKRLGVLLDNCKKKKEKGDEPSETTPYNKEENSLNDENQDGLH